MIWFLEDIKSHREEGECHKRSLTPYKTPPKVSSTHQPNMQPLYREVSGKKSHRQLLSLKNLLPSMQWLTEKTRKSQVEKDQFSSGAFRNAFKATDIADESKWVIKNVFQKQSKMWNT